MDTGRDPVATMQERQKFAEEYCRERGWDIRKLNWEQTLEIRAQMRWKNAGVNEPEKKRLTVA